MYCIANIPCIFVKISLYCNVSTLYYIVKYHLKQETRLIILEIRLPDHSEGNFELKFAQNMKFLK